MPHVYEIRNIVTNKRYIGSSKNLKKRLSSHKRRLKNNRHHNLYLQKAWNKYGPKSFEFNIITECLENNQFIIEQYYIDNTKDIYNIAKTVLQPEPNKKPCYSINKKTKVISRYKSITQASLDTGASTANICGVLNNTRTSCKGYYFSETIDNFIPRVNNYKGAYSISHKKAAKNNMKKAQKIASNNRKIKVVNNITNIIYSSISEAANKESIAINVLANNLMGRTKKNNYPHLNILTYAKQI